MGSAGASSVDKIIVHKYYISGHNDNDIAMIRLQSPITVGGTSVHTHTHTHTRTHTVGPQKLKMTKYDQSQNLESLTYFLLNLTRQHSI